MLFSQRYSVYEMTCGQTCGSVAYRNTRSRPMPRTRSANAGPAGAFSMLSANSRPSTPLVCSASASVPENGPSPAAISSSAAHTSSGIERSTFSAVRVAPRSTGVAIERWPSWLRALAPRASARPASAASSVPSRDMASVSSVPSNVRRRKPAEDSGGKKLAANLPSDCIAPRDRKSDQRRSSVAKLRNTSAATQSPIQRSAWRGGGASRIRSFTTGLLMPAPGAAAH